MRLSSLNLGYAPDATTFLNGVTLGAAPRPPPPKNPNPNDGVASGRPSRTPSRAPGAAQSPAPVVMSPNETSASPTVLSPEGEGTSEGSMPWKKYALWGAYGVGGLVLAFGAWKGVKMLQAKRAAGRDEPL